jgi:hypothetical protein
MSCQMLTMLLFLFLLFFLSKNTIKMMMLFMYIYKILN